MCLPFWALMRQAARYNLSPAIAIRDAPSEHPVTTVLETSWYWNTSCYYIFMAGFKVEFQIVNGLPKMVRTLQNHLRATNLVRVCRGYWNWRPYCWPCINMAKWLRSYTMRLHAPRVSWTDLKFRPSRPCITHHCKEHLNLVNHLKIITHGVQIYLTCVAQDEAKH